MREEEGKKAERGKGEKEGKEKERERKTIGKQWENNGWFHIAEYVYYSFMITITMVMRVLHGNEGSIKYLEVVCE